MKAASRCDEMVVAQFPVSPLDVVVAVVNNWRDLSLDSIPNRSKETACYALRGNVGKGFPYHSSYLYKQTNRDSDPELPNTNHNTATLGKLFWVAAVTGTRSCFQARGNLGSRGQYHFLFPSICFSFFLSSLFLFFRGVL
jgi:hypothetical protein